MLEIKEFILVQTGTADDMVGRNYTTHVTPQMMNQFQEQTSGGIAYTPEALSGFAGQMIVPDTQNGNRPLAMVNGWGTKRYRFVLKLGHREGSMADSTVRYIYTGYTDYSGYNPATKNFDPNMQLYFNNAIAIAATNINTPNGLQPFVQVNEISHLLNPHTLGGGLTSTFDPNTFQPIQQPSTLRPRDLFDHMATDAEARQRGVGIIDMGTSVEMKKASRDNNIPSRYLSRAVSSVAQAVSMATPQMNEQQLYATAGGYTSESAVHGDLFISSLMDFGYALKGFVTYNELTRLHPYLQHVTRFYGANTTERVVNATDSNDKYMIRRGENEQWITEHGVNLSQEALIANAVMQSVPAALLRNLVVRCVLVATNMRVGGGIHVEIRTPFAITDVPQGYLMSRIPLIERELASIIFNDLPINRHAPFFIEIHMDIFGESFVRVGFNGNRPVPFTSTSYCDAMTSPMVSATNHPLEQMSHDIRFLSGLSL